MKWDVRPLKSTLFAKHCARSAANGWARRTSRFGSADPPDSGWVSYALKPDLKQLEQKALSIMRRGREFLRVSRDRRVFFGAGVYADAPEGLYNPVLDLRWEWTRRLRSARLHELCGGAQCDEGEGGYPLHEWRAHPGVATDLGGLFAGRRRRPERGRHDALEPARRRRLWRAVDGQGCLRLDEPVRVMASSVSRLEGSGSLLRAPTKQLDFWRELWQRRSKDEDLDPKRMVPALGCFDLPFGRRADRKATASI